MFPEIFVPFGCEPTPEQLAALAASVVITLAACSSASGNDPGMPTASAAPAPSAQMFVPTPASVKLPAEGGNVQDLTY